jgi:hypothetical protein
MLWKHFEMSTDIRRVVAGLLSVPVEDVKLGPNLAKNGGFEEWEVGRPKWWVWSDMTGGLRNKGLFVGGADGLDGYSGRSTRISGLWLQSHEDHEPGRCGYWHWDEDRHDRRSIMLKASAPYILTFYYRTQELSNGEVTVWVSYEPEVLFAGDYRLPATNGEWRYFVAVGWNRADDESMIRPLVRSFAPGCTEFDEVQVRQIWLSEELDVTAGETQFWVIGDSD